VKEVQHIVSNYDMMSGPLVLEHIRILGGANYFSGGPVVHMRVNLKEFDEVYTNNIDGFYERLASCLPTLIEHHCSEGMRGGFFIRVREGTLLGHVIEHVAIELQTLAGMDVSYGKTRSSIEQGVFNIIFRFFDEYAGTYAGKAAVNLVNHILQGQEFNVLDVIEKLIFIREKQLLGPGTQAIVDELDKRCITWLRLDEYNLIQIGTGKYQKRIRATLTPQTSLLAVENSQDRYLTNRMFRDAALPVPDTLVSDSAEELKQYLHEHPGKYIIRPRHRKTTYSRAVIASDHNGLEEKISFVRLGNEQLMLQPFASGDIIRLLVIGENCCAAAKIELPSVTGDGKQTINELIACLNQDPRRTHGDKGILSFVSLDEETKLLLKILGMTSDSVPHEGENIVLKINPNPNNGSISENITDRLHEEYKTMALKAVRITGLDVAAVNIITTDFMQSPSETDAVLTEIYAAPNFRMYILPAVGKPQQVVPDFVDHVLRENKNFEIPLISVTGSTGKTVCTKMIYNCLRSAGLETGLSNSEGLFLEGRKVKEPETTNPVYVQLLLRDPSTAAAIVETPVENIMQYGLGYKLAHYGVVLNISDKHINEVDIKRQDDLAYAKSVVAEEVRKDGYTILNADDQFVVEMQNRLNSEIAWFSRNPVSGYTQQLIQNKTIILIAEDRNIRFFINGVLKTSFSVSDNHALYNEEGKIYESVLAGILVLLLLGIDEIHITNSLNTINT
jgi:cyanophycin synthetase